MTPPILPNPCQEYPPLHYGLPVDAISCGSLALDLALGIGGFPQGAISLLSGSVGTGKTLLSMGFLGEAQKMGGVAALIDLEKDLCPARIRRFLPAADELLIAHPASLAQALDQAALLANSGALSAIVIDSLMNLSSFLVWPHAQAKTKYLEELGGSLYRLQQAISHTQTALLLTYRQPEWVQHSLQSWRWQEDRLLESAASVSLEMILAPNRPLQAKIPENRVEIHIKKNKFAPTFPTIVLDILYNDDYIKINEVFELGLQFHLIIQENSAFHYQDQLLGKGRSAALHFLYQRPDWAQQIESEIRKRFLPRRVMPVAHD